MKPVFDRETVVQENMCSGDVVVDHTEAQKQDRIASNNSILLELAAADDLEGFRLVVDQKDFNVDDSGLWYGRSIGSKKMRLEERTPLMIASMFGSKQVLKFILGLNRVDVNKACGSDRATALHMAVAGGSKSSVEVVKLLINSSANITSLDVHGNLPVDLIPLVFGSSFNSKRKLLELLLNGEEPTDDDDDHHHHDHIEEDNFSPNLISSKEGPEKKEYPIDLSLPDMKNGIYNTDEFRMYTFKIKPCSRAYSHDWTECPFVHPGENARRRDPRKYHYSCVPCPEFRKGSCRQGDACEYAHGIFECWLHPAQYRTRLCKDEVGCNRKVCFFAHKPEELRPLHSSTGSAVLSPRSLSFSSDISPISPFSLSSPSIMIPPTSTSPPLWSNQSSPTMKAPTSRFRATTSRDLDFENELIRADIYRQQQLIDNFANPNFTTDYFEEIESRINPLHQNMNYPSNLPSSPLRMSASQMMNSRSSAFAKRSQSFIDRGTSNRQLGVPTTAASKLSDWGSPDGKLNWGIQKDELTKLRKSASFGVRGSTTNYENNVNLEEDQYFSPWVEEQLVA